MKTRTVTLKVVVQTEDGISLSSTFVTVEVDVESHLDSRFNTAALKTGRAAAAECYEDELRSAFVKLRSP